MDRFQEFLTNFHHQLSDALTVPINIKLPKDVQRVIIAGMGGSGIAGDVLASLLYDEKIPVTVCKDYRLPGWVDAKTLVFCISYSGNTQETLSSFSDAQKKKAHVVVIASGGKIRDFCMEYRIPHIAVPHDYPPRCALAYLLIPMLRILEQYGYLKKKVQEVQDAIEIVSQPTLRLKAEQLSQKIGDKTPVIYTSPRLAAAGLRWKQEFNENAKVHAVYNTFPELCHNELMGYSHGHGSLYVFILRDESDTAQVQKQMSVTKEIIKSKGYEVMEINMKGPSQLVKILTAIHLGDWLSYYHALAHKVDPYPVDLIEQLKKR
ncbi:MAG: bifunctional phosphoglucose/phosphomannose isomerase [Nanoarchaeota archaeon]